MLFLFSEIPSRSSKVEFETSFRKIVTHTRKHPDHSMAFWYQKFKPSYIKQDNSSKNVRDVEGSTNIIFTHSLMFPYHHLITKPPLPHFVWKYPHFNYLSLADSYLGFMFLSLTRWPRSTAPGSLCLLLWTPIQQWVLAEYQFYFTMKNIGQQWL